MEVLYNERVQSEVSFIFLFLYIDWEIPQMLLPPNDQLTVNEFPEHFEKKRVYTPM